MKRKTIRNGEKKEKVNWNKKFKGKSITCTKKHNRKQWREQKMLSFEEVVLKRERFLATKAHITIQ